MKDLYSIVNIKKIKWGFIEENEPIGLYPVMYPGWSGIIEGTGKILGKTQRNMISLHRKKLGTMFVDHNEWNALGAYTLKKVLKNTEWGFSLNDKILTLADKLTKFSSKIFRMDLRAKTDRQLYSLYKEYLDKHSNLYNYAVIPVYLDMYKPYLTNYLVEYLHRRVRKFKYHRTAKECFALLTIPDKFSKIQEEEQGLLRLATRKNTKILKRHANKYRYLGYNFEGPAFPDSYFKQRIKEILADPVEPKMRLQMAQAQKRVAAETHVEIIRGLKFDKEHVNLVEITQGFIYSKDYRKMSLVQSYYEIEPLLKELAKRFRLSINEIRNCTIEEIHQMSKGEIMRPAELSRRMKGFVFVVMDKQLPGKIFVDHRFSELHKYLINHEDMSEVNSFHGQTASLGKAIGKVKIIASIKDLKKMKDGDILVASMTNPDLVPAMKKAAAIVTDLGGITSHAAIVSRELKKPCVIGTKVATKVLKDGDMVEVDANNGTIKKI